jgi:O-antigen/teichoic acid export membrane protein
MQPLSLRRNFIFSFAGNFIHGFSQWLILSILTKKTTAEIVGYFILAIAIITPLQMFFNLQLRAVLATDTKEEFSFACFFTLRIITIFMVLFFSISIAFILGKGMSFVYIMFNVAMFKSVDSLLDISYGLYQKKERLDKMALSRSLRAVIGVVIFLILLFATNNAIFSLLGLSIGWFAVYSFYDFPNCQKISGFTFKANIKTLTRLFIVSLPLGCTLAIISLNSAIPKYFSERYLGIEQLAYFGSLAYITFLCGTAVSALGQATVTRLSVYFINNLKAFIMLLLKMTSIATILATLSVLIAMMFGEKIIKVIYANEYAAYNKVLVLLLVAGGVGYIASMLGYGLTATRYFKVQVPITIAVTLTLLFASILLIPKFGIVGSALSVLCGTLTQCVCFFSILIYVIKKKYKEYGK